MSSCILCISQIRQKKSIQLTELICKDITLKDAIIQHIRFNVLTPDSPSTQLHTCMTCFNAFKNFYRFLDKVNTSHAAIKTEQLPQQIFIASNELIVKVETPQIITPQQIKLEPVSKYDNVYTELSTVDDIHETETRNDDSDFDWSYEDPMIDDDVGENLQNDSKIVEKASRSKKTASAFSKPVNPTVATKKLAKKDIKSIKKELKSKSSKNQPIEIENNSKSTPANGAIPIKPAITSTGYIRYLPKSQITQEIIDSGQKFIVIDGIEYKISHLKPKPSKRKSKMSKSVGFLHNEDASRRKHPAHDPEGEEKIRNFMDIKCYVCSSQFDNFLKLKRHFRLFHPSDKVYLMCCERKFRRRFELLDHIEFHEKAIIIKCEICDKVYKNKSCLRTHMRFYHPADDAEKVICDECGKMFNNATLLKAHMTTHDIDETKIFECYICKDSKTFKNLTLLKNHIRSHHTVNKKNILTVCHICSSTVKESYLSTHMKTVHSDTRNRVKCEICGFWMLETTLKAHMLKHNDMGINCSVCGKFLKSRFSISVHMKQAHSENYKFRCEYCDKGFFKKLKMQEHIAAQHTREYIFKCRIPGCDRQFRSEANWRIHEKKAHPEEYDKLYKPFYKRDPMELREYEEMMEAKE